MNKTISKLVVMASMIILFLPLTSSAESKQAPQKTKKSRQIHKPSSTESTSRGGGKFGQFLKQVERAKSLDDLRKSYKRLKLSNIERKQLARKLSEALYSRKLLSLAKLEKRKLPSAAQRPVPDIKRRFQRLKRKARADYNHKIKLERKRLRVDARLPRQPARRTDAASVPPSRLPDHGATSARIDSVSPGTVQIGRNLTIHGIGFGRTWGLVALKFEPTRDNPRPLVHIERIVSWDEGRIVLTIPETAVPHVGGSDTRCMVWVKLAGGEVGPLHQVTLRPDPRLLQPEIQILSSPNILPQLPLIIQGRYFLSEKPGQIELHFAGRRFEAEVLDWTNEEVLIEIPNIGGLLRETGHVVLRNHVGKETRAPATFIPKKETKELIGSGEPGERGNIRVSCSPYYGQSRNRDERWLLCLFGWKEEYATNMRLQNGWQLIDTGHERGWRRGWPGAQCGAYYSDSPAMGRNVIHSKTVVWVNAFAECIYYEVLVVEGPLRVPHDASYNPANACILDDYTCVK